MSSTKTIRRLDQLSSQVTVPPSKNPVAAEVDTLLASNRYDEACQHALSVFLRPPRYRTNAQQAAVLQRASQSALQVDGIGIQTYTWDARKSTSTIILCHGFGTSAAFLTPLISQLLSSHLTHRIVALDQGAHGASTGDEASLPHYIAVLKCLVLNEQTKGNEIVSTIGHSVGATALIMLYAQEIDIFQKQKTQPTMVAFSPPLQSTTLMQTFCALQGLPASLVPGMRRLFRPSPEDVLTNKMAEGRWVAGLKVLVVQDANDVIADPAETELLVAQLQSSGAFVQFEKTEKLGHFKAVGNAGILELVQSSVV